MFIRMYASQAGREFARLARERDMEVLWGLGPDGPATLRSVDVYEVRRDV
jgi:hypothetical protein